MEQAYHQITAESMLRERMRLYELARYNEASALRHARDEGFVEGFIESFIESMTEGRAAENMTERFAEIMAENLAKGMAKHRVESMTRSLAESMAQVAQKMKSMGFSNEQIQAATGLSLEQ